VGAYVFTDEEQDSVAARLINLFTLPAQIFEVPVPDGSIRVKIRLLNDKENQEVSDIADRYGVASRMLVERRHILARAVLWIENIPIEMPESIKVAVKEETRREPTDVEQKLWVFEQCQPVLVDEFIKCYDELVKAQRAEINEIKKKFAERPAEPQQGIESSE